MEIGSEQLSDEVAITMLACMPHTVGMSYSHILKWRNEDVAKADDLCPSLGAEFTSVGGGGVTCVLVLEVLEQLEFSVCPLCKHGSAEGLHDLLDCDRLPSELILRRAESHVRAPASTPRAMYIPNEAESAHSDWLQLSISRTSC